MAIAITLCASKSFGLVRFIILDNLMAIWWTNSSVAGSSMMTMEIEISKW